MPTEEREQEGSSGCLFRLFWMILGNLVLFFVAVQLLFHPRGWFSSLDVVYWLTTVLILVARYADIRFFQGTTAEGKPATLRDWQRHAFILVLVTGVVWLAVHLLGVFWFSTS
ncbi:MAG: hypothetical protein JW829_18775 [Pirellulales bacterium]|nr:hypothetical protein [Pirellulales bacterium]